MVGRFCQRCKAQLDERRYLRGSRFCSKLCAQQDRIERRALQASKKCRLCGRPVRCQRTELEAVRSAHKPSHESIRNEQ